MNTTITTKSILISLMNNEQVIPFYSRFTPNGIERSDFIIGGIIFFALLFILKWIVAGRKRHQQEEEGRR